MNDRHDSAWKRLRLSNRIHSIVTFILLGTMGALGNAAEVSNAKGQSDGRKALRVAERVHRLLDLPGGRRPSSSLLLFRPLVLSRQAECHRTDSCDLVELHNVVLT